MRQYEAYCGVKVLTYCLISHHVHIMVKVPPREKRMMGDERFIERLSLIYSAAQMLHCKARYFTDGVVLGSREFVDKIFDKMKEDRPDVHAKRKTGARKLRQVQESKIYSLRDLRKKPLG